MTTVGGTRAARAARGGRRARHGRSRGPRAWQTIGPLCTAALAAGLATASTHGLRTLAAGVLFVQLVVLTGWTRTAPASGAREVAALTTALALGVDASLVLGGGEPWIPLVAGLGLFVAAAFAHQLWRRDGGAAPTRSMCVAVTGAVLVDVNAIWLAAWDAGRGMSVVDAALAGVGAAALITALATPLRPPTAAVVASALIGAAIAGASMTAVGSALGATSGLALGATGGFFAAGAHASADHATATGYGRLTLAAGLPLMAAAPAAYLIGKILTG